MTTKTKYPDYDLVRDIQNLQNRLAVLERSVKGSAFYPYTPVWDALTTSPSIGTGGALLGQYIRVGQMCHTEIRLTPGTGASFGSGAYTFTLPFTPDPAATIPFVGSSMARDVSVPATYPGFCWVDILGLTTATPDVLLSFNAAGAGAFTASGAPFTWATSDLLNMAITYRIQDGL